MVISRRFDRWRVGVVVVVIIASLLRGIHLGNLPDGLNRDEVALGYTAYSILLTGHDEHQVFWPVMIKSFGDWKLPGYVYTLIPFIKIFGLHDWVVRLPSALAGVVGVIGCGWLVHELLIYSSMSFPQRRWFVLLVMVGVTFSPWHLHISRVAYEANLGVTLLVVAVASLIRSFHSSKWLVVSATAWSFTLLSYHAYHLVSPLLLLTTLVIFHRQVWSLWLEKQKKVWTAGIVGILVVFVLLQGGLFQANRTKYAGLSIFSPQLYAQQLHQTRQLFPRWFAVTSRLIANFPLYIWQRFTHNMLAIFSPDFLFIKGGSHPTHNITGLGNLHLIELLFLLVCVVGVWRQRQGWQLLLIAWVIIAALPAVITLEPNHSIRFSAALVPLAILSAWGAWELWLGLARWPGLLPKRGGQALILISIAFSYFYLVTTYFVIFPTQDRDRWPWYMSAVVKQVFAIHDKYDLVVMEGESSSPYIYFLYYGQYHPALLAQNLEYYPEDTEGFQHVRRLENIYFQTVIWDKLEGHIDRVLYILDPDEIPADKLLNHHYQVLSTIEDPNSHLQWVVLDYARFR